MKSPIRYSLLPVMILLGLIVLGGCTLINRGKGKTKQYKTVPTNRTLVEYASPGGSSRNFLL
ncbi:MAG: hypothetical protein FWD31_07670, partial [Planctomycetaceae bacterium]|nr:hypothetical protein [Planctomycetaceae bacterium]